MATINAENIRDIWDGGAFIAPVTVPLPTEFTADKKIPATFEGVGAFTTEGMTWSTSRSISTHRAFQKNQIILKKVDEASGTLSFSAMEIRPITLKMMWGVEVDPATGTWIENPAKLGDEFHAIVETVDFRTGLLTWRAFKGQVTEIGDRVENVSDLYSVPLTIEYSELRVIDEASIVTATV